MPIARPEHVTLFRQVYDPVRKNFEELFKQLDEKKSATQYDCVVLLMQELNMSQQDATRIVHHSPYWEEGHTSISEFFWESTDLLPD